MNNSSDRATEPERGTIVAVHGAIVRVDVGDNSSPLRIKTKRNLEALACGDTVHLQWQRGTGHVVAVDPRRSSLVRPDRDGNTKLVAANIDRVIVVVAPQPPTPPVFIDRCLLNVEHQGIAGAIILNKWDLTGPWSEREGDHLRSLYSELGYPVLTTSAAARHGIDALVDLIGDGTVVLIGVSGAGKSSLARALVPGTDIAIGALSDDQRHGKHTTSSARLLHLPDGGRLIDSPGVRDFGAWHIPSRAVAEGFKEIDALSGQCHFRDCKHQEEPDCAVRAAVASGQVDASRWSSFCTILADCESAEAGRYD